MGIDRDVLKDYFLSMTKGLKLYLYIEDYHVAEVSDSSSTFGIGLKNDLSSIRIYEINNLYENLVDHKRFKKIFTIKILGRNGLCPKWSFKFH